MMLSAFNQVKNLYEFSMSQSVFRERLRGTEYVLNGCIRRHFRARRQIEEINGKG